MTNDVNNPLLDKILGEIRNQVHSDNNINKSRDNVENDDILELTNVITANGEVVNISNMKKELENKLAREALKTSVFNIIDNNIDEALAEKSSILSSDSQADKSNNSNPQISEMLEDDKTKNIDNHSNDDQEINHNIHDHFTNTIQPLQNQDNIEQLLSNDTKNYTAQAINHLISASNTNVTHNSKISSSLEELLVNAMKPELSSWLNANLPKIVSEIVEKEIKNLIKNTNS